MNKKINSQVLLIDMKEAAYEECIDRLLKLDKNNKHVELTYDLEFLTPFIGVLVASYLNNNTFKVETKIGDIGKNHKDMLNIVIFFILQRTVRIFRREIQIILGGILQLWNQY